MHHYDTMRMTLRLDGELGENVKQMAVAHRRSMNQEIVIALLVYVAGNPRDLKGGSLKQGMKPTPLNPCEEPEKITLNSTVSAFHLFSKGVATSSDEIMFALVSEKFGLTTATRLAAKYGWKCHRPLRELRAMLNEQGKGYTKRVKMARQV